MNSRSAVIAVIAVVSLLAGFALAAAIFSKRDGAGIDPEPVASASQVPEGATIEQARGGETTEAEQESITGATKVDAAHIADFTNRFFEIRSAGERAEATLAWFDSFGASDFEAFIEQVFELDAEEGTAGLSEEEYTNILSFLDQVFDDSEKALGSYFFERWVAKNPESLIQSLGAMPSESAISFGPYALPFLWASDPALGKKVFDDLRRRGPEDFDASFDKDEFAHQLFQVNEVESVRWAIGHGGEDFEFYELMRSGISDPEGVLGMLAKLPEGEQRKEAFESFFEYHGKVDASSAMALAERYKGGFDEEFIEETLDYIKTDWVLEDPANRLTLEDEDRVEEVLDEWILRDHVAVLNWIEAQDLSPADRREMIMFHASNHFGELPFDFAIEHAESNIHVKGVAWAAALSDAQLNRLIDEGRYEGLWELHRRDPEAAIAAVEENDTILVGFALGAGLEISGNESRLRWLELIPDSATDTYFIGWANDDPAAAWEASIDHPSVSGEVVSNWLDYEDVENVYAAVGDRFDENEDIQLAIIESWAVRDPWAAGETLLADGHADSVPLLIGNWVKRDSVEASRFIRENLDPGEQRDEAVETLAKGIASRDPEGAREWVESIQNDERRTRVLSEIETP